MKNKLYWAFNLPLQVWPRHKDGDDEQSPVVDATLLNYMPRKERCEELLLSDVIGEQTREEFFETAARHFENLARLMRVAAKDNTAAVYYHSDGMDAPAEQCGTPAEQTGNSAMPK